MSEIAQKIGTLDIAFLNPTNPNDVHQRIISPEAVVWLLREALSHDANDIHINTGHPVIIEVNNRMFTITRRAMDSIEVEQIANVLRGKEGASVILSQGKDYDGLFPLKDNDGVRRRLRVNMTATCSMRSQQSISIVLRPMLEKPPRPEDIGLDVALAERLFPQKGAVYVVGPTGSGKTTTFASIIRHAAETGCAYHGHLACYESPPEYDLEGMSSKDLLITQVAIHQNWGLPDFASGVRNALRRHPSAMLIGEVRDLETVQAVLEAALTGHPVFGTVHADSPAVAFRRLVSRFPANQQRAGLYDLIENTAAIVAQRLVNTINGGRAAVREWIVFDDDMRERLLMLESVGEVVMAIKQMVREHGCTFAMSAQELFDEGKISNTTLQSMQHR